ncbi:MAG: hypothetical protein WBP81_11045 [Solirubrobacteraceae bacterium]
MGANPWVVLGLNGTGDYTFVGLDGLHALDGPNAGAELSQVETGAASARLTGVFARNNQGLWQAGTNGNPTATNGPAAFEPALTKMLAQPPQPFPAFDTPDQRLQDRPRAGLGTQPSKRAPAATVDVALAGPVHLPHDAAHPVLGLSVRGPASAAWQQSLVFMEVVMAGLRHPRGMKSVSN